MKVLNKAKKVCENSGFNVDEQLVEVNKLSKRNNNARTNIQDFKLTRYMCYLVVQNADPSKEDESKKFSSVSINWVITTYDKIVNEKGERFL